MLLLMLHYLLYGMTSCFDQGTGGMYMGHCFCSFPFITEPHSFPKTIEKILRFSGCLFSIVQLPKIHLLFVRIKKCVLVSTMVKKLDFKGEGDSLMEIF